MLDLPGIVLQERGKLPSLETILMIDPGPGEVQVRMVASGICHTDIAAVRDARTVPVLLGHEGAGVVEKVGDDVSNIEVGDHVVINWQCKCGQCKRCLSGRDDLCENVQGTQAPRVFWKDKPLPLLLNAGTFCPVVTVPAGGLAPIRKDMPLDKAALLGCAVATGVGAALNTAQVRSGESVAIIGAGGVGMNVIQGCRFANADTIIAIDPDDTKLARATDFGATHTVNPRETDPVSAVRDLSGGRGVEHVFEVVGLPDLMLQGIEMLCRGGILTLIGAAARDAVLPFHPRRFMSQQQTIKGCIYGNIRPVVDLAMFADWYMSGKLLLDPLHTKTVSLEEIPEVFKEAEEKQGFRTIVEFDRESS